MNSVSSLESGVRHEGIILNVELPSEFILYKYQSRLGVIAKIPLSKPKLMHPVYKKVILVEENSGPFIMDLYKTLCSPEGPVFDGFLQTLNMAIAELQQVQKCLVVEQDRRCFNLAFQNVYSIWRTIYGSAAPTGVPHRDGIHVISSRISPIWFSMSLLLRIQGRVPGRCEIRKWNDLLEGR